MLRTACFLFLASILSAQTPAHPTFEVASIKPIPPGTGPGDFRPRRGGPGTSDPTRIVWPVNLSSLVSLAYGVPFVQVLGPDGKLFYPDGNFELNATMRPETTQEELQSMLQNLLAERFHVAVHHTTKLFPGYELTVAPGGPKLKASTPVERIPPPDIPVFPPAPEVRDETGFPRFRPGARVASVSPGLGKWGLIRARYRGESMAEFAAGLPGMINQSNGAQMGDDAPRVADRTSLTGVYEFTLEFAGGTGVGANSMLADLRRAGNPDAASASEPTGSGGGPTLQRA